MARNEITNAMAEPDLQNYLAVELRHRKSRGKGSVDYFNGDVHTTAHVHMLCTPSRDSPKRGYIYYKCMEGNLPHWIRILYRMYRTAMNTMVKMYGTNDVHQL